MSQNNISSNPKNFQILKKPLLEPNSSFVPKPPENKNIFPNHDHSQSFPFKVVQKEKDSNFFILNSEKNSKNSAKNINIIKPKFIIKTIPTNNKKINYSEETPSLNLSLNLSSSAFQPQIIKEKENKEFITKVNNKIFNLIVDTKNNVFKIELHQIIDNVFLLKYFYGNNYTLPELKLINKFFCLFDNVSDMKKELEKWLSTNRYTVTEDPDNKIAKVQMKVPILQNIEDIELKLNQKNYTNENLFEILCKKVAVTAKEYEQRINKLELDNKYLFGQFLHLLNITNTMNMNYSMNNRDNNFRKNVNNNTINSSINNMNRNYLFNNINKKKSTSLTKNKNINNKYDENKENNIINEEPNELSHNSNSVSENDKNSILNKKRPRPRKNSYSSNKNNSPSSNKNNNNDLISETNSNNENADNMNYYELRDIKAKKINRIKGLYEIIHTPDELYMIINKILYKYNKYKKNSTISNYQNYLQFCILNLFDSSSNGDSAFTFHNLCDYKKNTISLVETTSGHRFGGYTSECFESPNLYFDKKDNLSFVFSLDKMRIYDVIKGKYAISCDKNYGPYFRDDQICVVNEFFSNESGTCIKGKGFNTTKNYELNFGKKYFKIKRLQVFQVKIKKIR